MMLEEVLFHLCSKRQAQAQSYCCAPPQCPPFAACRHTQVQPNTSTKRKAISPF
ncbi:hypothetical protein PACTADRAFT_51360, partial [Pachysolen tannophilus NRRL Y-2460]